MVFLVFLTPEAQHTHSTYFSDQHPPKDSQYILRRPASPTRPSIHTSITSVPPRRLVVCIQGTKNHQFQQTQICCFSVFCFCLEMIRFRNKKNNNVVGIVGSIDPWRAKRLIVHTPVTNTPSAWIICKACWYSV